MTRQIKLVNSPLVALVDSSDYEKVRSYAWRAQRKCRRTKLAGPTEWYATLASNRNVSMHRFILDAPTGVEVDHKDHNGLDNRRRNLRIATHQQNSFNKRMPLGRSGYRGVNIQTWPGSKKKFIARITVNGRRINLGTFGGELDAAQAYDKAAKKYHGEFARLNFPE